MNGSKNDTLLFNRGNEKKKKVYETHSLLKSSVIIFLFLSDMVAKAIPENKHLNFLEDYSLSDLSSTYSLTASNR